MSILQEIQALRCCPFSNNHREQDLYETLHKSICPTQQRLLLAYSDERDLLQEKVSQDNYQAGLRDGIELILELFPKV